MKGIIEMQVLKQADPEIKLTIESPVDPKEFYKNRKGLYVWSGFEERALPHAKQIDAGANFTIESLDVVQSSTDEQIEKSLGNKNTFDMGGALAIIADLIGKQAEGQEGTLLTNGYANIFYTPVCVVRVFWSADDREWHVNTWDRDDGRWLVGRRVFSPQLPLDL